MREYLKKHEELLCYGLIVLYVIINSFCMRQYGLSDVRSTIINTLFSIVVIAVMMIMKRVGYYGLQAVKDANPYLYFIPLALISCVNLINGVHVTDTPSHIVCHILTMVNVGFLEEIIFRGFLFRMMAEDNAKTAVIGSSLIFGIGHIVNLLNGAQLIPTLLQIFYATSIGYLFVTIFVHSGSLLPCMISHAVINATSIFNGGNTVSMYIMPVVLIVVPLVYASYIHHQSA